jgi:hypothetical protein
VFGCVRHALKMALRAARSVTTSGMAPELAGARTVLADMADVEEGDWVCPKKLPAHQLA